VEPISNCSSASGGWVCADAAAVMQAVESETLILYHTDLRGEWPRDAARALAARLPYGKRLAASADSPGARASLAGIALALRALSALTGRAVRPGEIVFAHGAKPRLAHACPDFSISHSGPWVGCAAVRCGRVGFDVEMGSSERIASFVAREAALKACGAGIRALREVHLSAGHASCRGELLHAHALQLFPGAAACVMTSLALPGLGAHALSPAELFAP
jgi:phosphopantetheinyl transferase